MSNTIQSSQPTAGVAQLTIERPERRNALDGATYRALTAALKAADQDQSIRVIVLTGSASCFTAGNDLADFADAGADAAAPAFEFLITLAAVRTPLIAAIEGPAIGIGTTMLLHCDLAYAGDSAVFRLPFVHLGLCPEGAATLLLPRIAGSKRAAELLLLGEVFAPALALEAGLLNAIVPAGTALATALEKAGKLAALPAQAVNATRMLLRRGQVEAITETIALEADHFSRLLDTQEAKAAFAAFLNKSK